ncbi:Orotate phosphoribosyltransferase [bioreactor metagenome]|uniref:orotate phosphoribosyltransferase n=1 Tax=bioreactor metagenome TaxID=1076179 RepID=A0A645AWF0_9ZZZZ
MNHIGSKIKQLRVVKGSTQEELASYLQITYQSVSKWETGGSLPDISYLPHLAAYFGITLDELFGYRLDALNYKERFIQFMANSGVLKFGEFKLNSGRISPYFINTGNYRTGAQIAKLGEFYAECIREKGLQADVLYGPAYKGIPLAVATGIMLYAKFGMDWNYSFDRKEVKDHGEGGMIVGYHFKDGDRLLIVEDAITSGKVLREAMAKILGIAKVKVSDMLVSVDRLEKGLTEQSAIQEVERNFGIHVHSIVTIDDIIAAIENGIILGSDKLPALMAYKEKFGVSK